MMGLLKIRTPELLDTHEAKNATANCALYQAAVFKEIPSRLLRSKHARN